MHHQKTAILSLATLLLAGCGSEIAKDRDPPIVVVNNGNNTATNNTSTTGPLNNGAPNVTANNVTANNISPNNTTTVDPVVAEKCANYCELFVGQCVIDYCRLGTNGEQDRVETYAACVGDGDPTLACPTLYAGNADFRAEVDALANVQCDAQAARDLRCSVYSTACDCPTPVVGTACRVDGDCDAADLTPMCIAEQPDGSYPGGQCFAAGCEVPDDATPGQLFSGGSTGCGLDGACFVMPDSTTICLPTCTENTDCHRAVTGREDVGYACNIVGTTAIGGPLRPLGFCETACVTDSDCKPASPVCGDNRACRNDCVSDADCASDLRCTGMSVSGRAYCELN